MFCVQVKDQPGTYYVDKKTFDEQIVANAQHHLVENRKQPISPATRVSTPNLENPLTTPVLNFNEPVEKKNQTHQPVKQKSQQEPLGTPTLNFSDEDN